MTLGVACSTSSWSSSPVVHVDTDLSEGLAVLPSLLVLLLEEGTTDSIDFLLVLLLEDEASDPWTSCGPALP